MCGPWMAREATSICHSPSIDIISTTKYSASAQLQIRMFKFANRGNGKIIGAAVNRIEQNKKRKIKLIVDCCCALCRCECDFFYLIFVNIIIPFCAHIVNFINIVHFSSCYARMLHRHGPTEAIIFGILFLLVLFTRICVRNF